MTSGLGASVPNITELRAVAIGLRRGATVADAAERGRSSPPDDRLLALFGQPFASIEDVDQRLARAAVYLRSQDDRRSVFATIYAAMTARVVAGIEEGDFDDPAWMRRYLVEFADRYRTAVLADERGHSDRPAPWQLAFDASTGGRTVLLQDALLGVNAHINYDLPHALDAVGIDPDRLAKRRDHDRINAVLTDLLDAVQRTLTERYDAAGYGQLDAALGRIDETVTFLGLREARDLAWRHAVGLTDAPLSPLREFVAWRVRLVSTGAGHVILAPSADPTVLDALRAAEEGDVGVGPVVDEIENRCRDRRIDLA